MHGLPKNEVSYNGQLAGERDPLTKAAPIAP
jgi:hypothetical protein